MAFARTAIGEEADIDPLEALLKCVHLAAGTVAYYRMQLCILQDGEVGVDLPPALTRAYDKAVENQCRFAKAAMDAGVEEWRFALTEEAGQLIASAIDRAAGPLELTRDQRAAFAERVGKELAALESPGWEAPKKVEQAPMRHN